MGLDNRQDSHAGNSGQYLLKPVIRMIPRTLTGIAGYVQTGLAGVTVSAQKDGVVMKATQPNTSGQFILAPLDPTKGPYDVVFTGTNLTTSVIASVPVVAGQTTTLNSSADSVPMPTSTSGNVTGTVGPAGARDTASVRALQTVGTVPAVEVAQVNVDPLTGDYSLFLPTAAPRLLVYSNPMVTPLNFQAQNATAGKYKLEASATGYQTQLGSEITAAFGSILPNQNFTLVPLTQAAIVGYVQNGLAGVTVTAQKNGVVMQATQPDVSGQFVLTPLDPTKGPFDVVFIDAGILLIPISRHLLESTTNFITADVHTDSFRLTGNQFPGLRETGVQVRGWWFGKKVGFRGGVYEGIRAVNVAGANRKSLPQVAGLVNIDILGSEEGGWLYGRPCLPERLTYSDSNWIQIAGVKLTLEHD